ncbi:PREDICTED: trypsin epsilon-like [Vollenhovia emeryi]|uniref:trypsin epsilon-like n=1 Tax=Vollenhovia emeryi TaxID=411798 RepID=UPI0005F586BE|nr:PREDICTED: trypsin epsilon-like [Vollenhovia emeryi]
MMTQSAKMRGAIIVLCFVGFLFQETGGNATYIAQPKIIGGQPIDIKYRPFMLSLHNSHGFLCGASILSRTWAITALHCLVSVSSTRFYVRAGSNKTDRGGSVHRVTNIHVYNDTYRSWFSRLLHHDIAIFQVKPPFQFSRTVRPVRLPRSTHEISRELLVCGWGYINNEQKENAEILMGVYVQHVPYEICVNATTSYATLVKDDYHLCYGTQGKDACFGDSGGALAGKRTIYGIVSFGHGCGKVAGVYVKVSYYEKWIKAVTNL